MTAKEIDDVKLFGGKRLETAIAQWYGNKTGKLWGGKQAFAKEIDHHKNTVTNWTKSQTDYCPIDLKTREAVAKVLDIPVAELVAWWETGPTQENSSDDKKKHFQGVIDVSFIPVYGNASAGYFKINLHRPAKEETYLPIPEVEQGTYFGLRVHVEDAQHLKKFGPVEGGDHILVNQKETWANDRDIVFAERLDNGLQILGQFIHQGESPIIVPADPKLEAIPAKQVKILGLCKRSVRLSDWN